MAKRKYEFRPDNLKTDLFNKLALTRTQRMKLLRWVLYALLLVALSVIQDVVLCRVKLFGATTDLVPLAIILICVQLGGDASAIFALLAACFYKFSGTAPGYYVIGLLPILSVFAAVTRQSLFRKSPGSTLLCATVAMVLYELGIFGFGLLFRNTTPDRILRFLTTSGLSLLSYVVLYPATNAIERIGETTWND